MQEQREKLIIDLRRIKNNNFEVDENEKPWNYAQLMLKYIGDIDSELRDELIYEVLVQWICTKEYFDQQQLIELLKALLDQEHVFLGIGSKNNDTVFTRAFSVLAIVLFIYRHRQKSLFDESIFIKLKDSLLRYCNEEKDLRGFISEYGWAHGAAHCADALGQLIRCKESSGEVCIEVLKAVQAVMHNGEGYILHDEEDERIATIIVIMLKEGLLAESSILEWLDNLSACTSWDRSNKQRIARVNSKNLVRCLYFRLINDNSKWQIKDILMQIESKLNNFVEAKN